MRTKAGRKRGNWEKAGVLVLTLIMVMAVAGEAGADPTSPPSTFTAYTKDFQSDPFTGMASMSIPMETGGPGLTLNYSSGAVDERMPNEKANWVGLGWSLSGLGGIRMDKDGKYYLNGGGVSGELVCVSSGGCAAGGEYKTRTESFAKITHITTPSDYWTVKSRNGTEYRFGYNADSEWAYDKPEWNPSGTFREWLLDQVQDADGNTTLISYNNFTDQYCINYANYDCGNSPNGWQTYVREMLPKEIKWNYRGAPLAKVGHDRKVTFNWGSRTDYDNVSCCAYLGRYGLPEYSSRYKLDSISVWIDLNDNSGTVPTPEAGELIRRYDLGYDYSAGGLTLLSVSMKGTDGTSSLPSTTFAYTNSRLTSVSNGIGGSSSIAYAEVTDSSPTEGTLTAWAGGPEDRSSYFCGYGCKRYDPSGSTGPYANNVVVGNGPEGTVDIFGGGVYQTAEFTVSADSCWYGWYAGVRQVIVRLHDDAGHVIDIYSRLLGYSDAIPEQSFSGTMKLVRKNDGKIDVYWNGSIIGNVSWPYSVAKLRLYASSSGNSGYISGCYYFTGWATITTGPVTASFKGRNAVTSKSTNDGLGNIATTTYQYTSPSYPGGPYSEFRGFRTNTTTRPDGSKSVTYFHQGDIYKGLVEKSYVKSSTGSIYAATVNSYDYQETNPVNVPANAVKTDEALAVGGVYLARLRETNSYTVEEATADEALPAGTYKRAKSTLAYDTYGNVTDGVNLGEVDGTGNKPAGTYDKKQTLTEYINDTAKNILGVPMHVTVYGYDINNAWDIQRESKTYYDDQAYGSLLKGKPTKTESYKDATTFLTATMGYDAYGNLSWTKDANANAGGGVNSLLHTTDITYDTVYNAYPKTTQDVNDNVTTINYDTLMRPIEAIDINGISTKTEYDVFGRVTAVRKFGDYTGTATVQTVYNDIADLVNNKPAYVKTIAKDGSTDGLISYTFADGLGRTIQSKSKGVGTNEWYTVESYYNAQGRLDRSGVPYTTTTTTPDVVSRKAKTAAGVWTVPGYDGIGRVYKTTKPDGTYGAVTFGRWVTTVKDVLGHQKKTYTDGLGMTTKVENYTGDGSASNPYALYSTITFKYNTGTGELVQTTTTPAPGQ